jgi:hypothetical protein
MATCVHPVQDGHGLWRTEEKAPFPQKLRGLAQFGAGKYKTGFQRGFSQLTFPAEGGEYKPSGFPTQPEPILPPGAGWARKRPVRRDYE